MSGIVHVNLNDLRNNTDGCLPQTMTRLGYDQTFFLSNLKLGLGYFTVFLAGILFYMDKIMNISFNESKHITIGVVVLYCLISAVLLYIQRTHVNVKYTGKKNTTGQRICIATHTNKYNPVYHMNVILDGNKKDPIRSEIKFTDIYDYTGCINYEALAKFVEIGLESKKKQ